MSLGARIASHRKKKNLKQIDLARILGLGQRQLVRWENDQSYPRPKALEALAKALDTTVEELATEPPPQSLDQLADPELRELLAQIPEFSEQKLQALKVLLRDMVTSHQVTRVTTRHLNFAS